jgi:pimeloyl-ACP methyl ester carboxylesterase
VKEITFPSTMTQSNVVTYPIPHDEKGGTLFLFGKVDVPQIVIMCPGFPDDQSVFFPLAKRIAACNCLVGVACLAGYDKGGWREGYTFEDWVVCLKEAVKILRRQSTVSNAKFTGIFHDWGCVAGSMFTNRVLLDEDCKELVPDQLIFMDALLPPHPSSTVDTKQLSVAHRSIQTLLYTALVMFSYQTVLATCFLLQRFISKQLATWNLFVGAKIVTWLNLNPVGKKDSEHIEAKTRANMDQFLYMCYPYYYVLKSLFFDRLAQNMPGAHLPVDLQKTPILYMYGLDKNIHFHDPVSLALVETEGTKGGKSKVVKLVGAGHWMYLQQPSVCFDEIATFLKQKGE